MYISYGMTMSTRIVIRNVSRYAPLSAHGTGIGPHDGVSRPKTTRLSRQERVDTQNLNSESRLRDLDSEYNVIDKSVTRVLDLGWVPGNWAQYTLMKMCQVHDIEIKDFDKKCHILGFDLLFGNSIKGLSSLQGNIYAKSSTKRILQHFKDASMSGGPRKVTGLEQAMGKFDGAMEEGFWRDQETSRSDTESEEECLGYKPQLILSDLARPFMQVSGFYNSSVSGPHSRSRSNKSLNRPFNVSQKACIDLADAAIMLTCEVLAKNGKMVLCLNNIGVLDQEIELLHDRLERIFTKVVKQWVHSKNPDFMELYFICLGKKSATIDPSLVF